MNASIETIGVCLLSTKHGDDRDTGSAVLFAATNQYLNGQTVVYVLATGTV